MELVDTLSTDLFFRLFLIDNLGWVPVVHWFIEISFSDPLSSYNRKNWPKYKTYEENETLSMKF